MISDDTVVEKNDVNMGSQIGDPLIANTIRLGLNASINRDWHSMSGLPFALPIEANFARDYHRVWLFNNWFFSVYISTAYIIFVLISQHLMRNRNVGYGLRALMALWSFTLALFSVLGTIRCLPEFVHVIVNDGLYSSYCDSSYYSDLRLTFWYWLFVWSKVVELGDTVFIILRRQKLIALHWIHHVLTLWYAFFVIGEAPGTARWMVNMNFVIHSMMYSYYTLKALQIRVSRRIAMAITCAQITQMIFGLYINLSAYYYKSRGHKCHTSTSASASGLIIYSLFFILFIKFFIKAYFPPFLTLKNAINSDNCNSGATKNKLTKVD